MARSSFKCSKVCACFLLLFTISAASLSNEYFNYKTEFLQERPDTLVLAQLLEDTHILYKREIPPGSISEPILDNRSNALSAPPSSPIPDSVPPKDDAQIYYKSTLQTDSTICSHYWNDLSNSGVKVNNILSRSHRRAKTIKLSFEFPFYGNLIKNVTVATGGFLYTGEYIHSWLAATQYIAPLMANFNTNLSNDSSIKYVDNGTAFTVQWERVVLEDEPKEGEFTFQVTLHQNGDIVFVYQNVPLDIKKIKNDHHPIKVGLSDAYLLDSNRSGLHRKTIYEYHRIKFAKEDIKNWTVIYLKALPTCFDSKTCTTCLTRKLTSFTCSWCPSINKCSDGGIDRHRQDWLVKGCDKKHLSNESMCSHISQQFGHF